MRFVPTLVHGIADYLVGFVLIALPLMIDMGETARWTLVAMGGIVLLYSLLTDYELGAIRHLRVRFHLFLDAIAALAFFVLPSLIDPPDAVRWTLYLFGILSVILFFTTRQRAQGSAVDELFPEETT